MGNGLREGGFFALLFWGWEGASLPDFYILESRHCLELNDLRKAHQ